MNVARVGSRGDSLSLERDDVAESFTDTLQSHRLSAATLPREHYDLRGLADYLVDLANNAMAGWSGDKEWESLEGDVHLRAQCRAGHITLTARLSDRIDPSNHGWIVRLDITLDPGEELRQAANDVSDLLSRA